MCVYTCTVQCKEKVANVSRWVRNLHTIRHVANLLRNNQETIKKQSTFVEIYEAMHI